MNKSIFVSKYTHISGFDCHIACVKRNRGASTAFHDVMISGVVFPQDGGAHVWLHISSRNPKGNHRWLKKKHWARNTMWSISFSYEILIDCYILPNNGSIILSATEVVGRLLKQGYSQFCEPLLVPETEYEKLHRLTDSHTLNVWLYECRHLIIEFFSREGCTILLKLKTNSPGSAAECAAFTWPQALCPMIGSLNFRFALTLCTPGSISVYARAD